MRSLKEYTLRVAGVIEESIVDGPGIRFVLFLQGCRLHCPGCQNPHTWDFEGGTLVHADEVLARIKAVLRRFSEKTGDEDSSIIRLPQLEISLENYQVKAAGKVIPCTPKEVEILHMLCSNVGQVFSREQILSRVWGYDSNAVENHVEVYVGFLRKKLLSIGSNIKIVALRRMGYHLEVAE